MYYFKFVYNFVYISFVFLKLKLDNNKSDLYLDFELDFDKLYNANKGTIIWHYPNWQTPSMN